MYICLSCMFFAERYPAAEMWLQNGCDLTELFKPLRAKSLVPQLLTKSEVRPILIPKSETGNP